MPQPTCSIQLFKCLYFYLLSIRESSIGLKIKSQGSHTQNEVTVKSSMLYFCVYSEMCNHPTAHARLYINNVAVCVCVCVCGYAQPHFL